MGSRRGPTPRLERTTDMTSGLLSDLFYRLAFRLDPNREMSRMIIVAGIAALQEREAREHATAQALAAHRRAVAESARRN